MFQDNLKTLCKNKGITQEKLAARLKVVRQIISKWEKGQSVPDAEMLVNLADILKCRKGNCLARELKQTNARMQAQSSYPTAIRLIVEDKK